jgi:poly(A) polymerase/tRNA nucleotidyltransferase (CCA-adding enzyme)
VIDLPGVKDVWAALPEARIVGGAVRDGVLGRPVSDVDFASPLPPDAVMARLRKARIKAVPTGLAHGTVTAVIGGRGFEITTLRRDVATDGRHALVDFTDDWEVDASRRDFTINAMSVGPDGTVFDYFSGRADLAAGRVRFVGDAAARITEDFLRIFRFFRFFARYGRGTPDAAAVAAIAALKDGIAQLSAERVWSELKAILKAEDPREAVGLMARTGVLGLVMPGADVAGLAGLVGRGGPVEPLLRVATLLGEEVDVFAGRLRLSGAEQERLAALRVEKTLTPAADDAALRRALAAEEGEILVARSWLKQDERAGWDGLRQRIAGMARPVFPLRGRDVTAIGVPAGPAVGAVLEEVRRWWLAGGCSADRVTCLQKMAECAALFRPTTGIAKTRLEHD